MINFFHIMIFLEIIRSVNNMTIKSKIAHDDFLAACSHDCKNCGIDCDTIFNVSKKVESYSDYENGIICGALRGNKKFTNDFLKFKEKLHFSSNGELFRFLLDVHNIECPNLLDEQNRDRLYYVFFPNERELKFINGMAIALDKKPDEIFRQIFTKLIENEIEPL